MKMFQVRSIIPQGDLIALKEKIGVSLHSGIYRKTACISKIFMAVIIAFFVLMPIPSVYALTVDSQEKNVTVNHQSFDPSDGYSFSSSVLLIKVKPLSKDMIKKSPKPDDTGIASLDNLNKKYGVSKFEQVAIPGQKSKKDVSLFNWYKITLNDPKKTITKNSAEFYKLKRVMDSYKSDPNLDIVEPDYTISIFLAPNDPYYSSSGSWNQAYPDLWGIRKINSEQAWDQTTGSTSIIVAGIDTGVDRNHVDIKDNMWVNTREIPNNGIDDDGNGYVDDYYGWNWVANSNDPMDDNGHGTHTAGTIAATGNNGIGVVGVNWKSKIIALKFLDSTGSGYISNGIKALQYAADMGARVSSNSWGCMCNSVAMDDAIQYEHDKGMVVVAAAGNNNADALDFSPASSDGVITVAASDYNDAKASFSNWGEKIDVAAPGVNILSTRASNSPMCTASITVGTNYCVVSGTSMATPHVAGLAALILSKNPNLTNEEVRQIIRNGATDLGTSGWDPYFGYGRINAQGSINLAANHVLTPYIESPHSRTKVSGNIQIIGSIPGPNFASYKIETGAGRAPTTWTTLYTSTAQPAGPHSVLATIDTSRATEGLNIFRITATDTLGKVYQIQVDDITVDNFDGIIYAPTALVSLSTNNEIKGTAATKNISFGSYVLESSPDNKAWTTANIILANGGLQPVTSGTLGYWNTSPLTNGNTYYLRLTVKAANGNAYQTTNQVRVDSNLVPDWPKVIPYADIEEISPIFADLNGDGQKELLYNSQKEGKVYAYKEDGTNMPGFPVVVGGSGVGDYTEMLQVADIDNDGKPEIIGSSINFDSNGNPYDNSFILKNNGTFYPGWNRAIKFGGKVIAVANLNGDANKEIISTDNSAGYNGTEYINRITLHAYQPNGQEMTGFPKTTIVEGYDYTTSYFANLIGINAVLVTDLDNDGKLEIAMSDGFNKFYLFDNTGTLLPGWPYTVQPVNNNTYSLFSGVMASGDAYGDGQNELFAVSSGVCTVTIVSGGGIGWSCNSGGTNTGYAYGFKKDGTVLAGWPKSGFVTEGGGWNIVYSTVLYTVRNDPLYGPSLSDVDNDGKDEIIVPGHPLTIFDVEGKKSITTPDLSTQPALADVNGDGIPEIIAGYRNNNIVRALKPDGTTYWSVQGAPGNVFYTPMIAADMDNDGQMEVAGIDRTTLDTNNAPLGTYHLVYLWKVPKGAGVAKYEWPMFSHDLQRTGGLNALTSNQTPTPTPTPTPTLIPTVVISSPNNGAILNTSTVGVSGTTAETGSSVQNVTVSVDGYTYLATTNDSWSSWSSIASSLLSGSHTITAKATDYAGNTATTSTTITVDTKPPTVSIKTPSNGTAVKKNSAVTITVSASDNLNAVKLVQLYVNGALQCGVLQSSGTDYTCKWKVPGTASSMTYSLLAKANDSANNVGQSAIVYVTSK